MQQYTKEQIQTQITLVQMRIDDDSKWRDNILYIDYPPAVKYGEHVRKNHLKRVESNIKYNLERKANLEKKLKEMQ